MVRRTSVAAFATAAMVAVCVGLPAPAQAIVVAVTPNNHIVPAQSPYNKVGWLATTNYIGTASVVNPWFILTAKHVAYELTGTFTLNLPGGQQVYGLGEKFRDAPADIALYRLTSSTNLSGYKLYESTDEQGKQGILVGYGMSGTGQTGQTSSYPWGTNRWGYNVIEGFTDPHFTDPWVPLVMKFDNNGDPNESLAATGDSGGPTFITDPNGELRIAGIHSSVYYHLEYPNDPRKSDFGDTGYDVRISDPNCLAWIRSKIPAQPATVTGDFNIDGATNATDIDNLWTKYGGADLWYDMSGDSTVNQNDTNTLIHTTLATEYGDLNLDHKVNFADYQILETNFGATGTAGWARGDFDGDKDVDLGDYQLLANHFGFGEPQPIPPPPVPVPEPASLALLAAGVLALPARRKRR